MLRHVHLEKQLFPLPVGIFSHYQFRLAPERVFSIASNVSLGIEGASSLSMESSMSWRTSSEFILFPWTSEPSQISLPLNFPGRLTIRRAFFLQGGEANSQRTVSVSLDTLRNLVVRCPEEHLNS